MNAGHCEAVGLCLRSSVNKHLFKGHSSFIISSIGSKKKNRLLMETGG